MIEKFLVIDQRISDKLHLSEKHRFLRSAAAFFAHSGDSWFLLAGLFLIWLFTDGLWHRYSAIFGGAIIFQATFVIGIKFLIRRRRPEGEWGGVYRNTDPHSFPSGHAVRAVMLAVMAWSLDIQPINWILTIWAPLVSIARVALGVHYFFDVAAGWGLGVILAEIMLALQPFFYILLPFIF